MIRRCFATQGTADFAVKVESAGHNRFAHSRRPVDMTFPVDHNVEAYQQLDCNVRRQNSLRLRLEWTIRRYSMHRPGLAGQAKVFADTGAPVRSFVRKKPRVLPILQR